jgi:hypothetical protein
MGVALWAMGVAPLAKMGVAGHPNIYIYIFSFFYAFIFFESFFNE